MTQSYSLAWLDGNIDPLEEDWQMKLAQVRNIINDVRTFTKLDACIQFLNTMEVEKVFLIASGYAGQDLVPKIHSMTQLDTIYILCGNVARHKIWTQNWPKIQGVFTSIESICKSLKKITCECDHATISISFIPKDIATTTISDQQNAEQLDPSYIYVVIFKEIILESDEDEMKAINQLVAYCQQHQVFEFQIKRLQREYHHKSPIWWYTDTNFLSSMLNKAIRSMDIQVLTKMKFFIRNLHRQLEQLHTEQWSDNVIPFTVYRAQGFSQRDLQRLINAKGGFISFNSFLSTNKEKRIAMNFIEHILHKYEDIVGTLFIMTIDPSKVSSSIAPFALIDDYSAIPQEKEILFSIPTVFRIAEIKQVTKDNRLWEVQLNITDSNDPQLATLIHPIKTTIDGEGLDRIGKFMLQVGHFNRAEELYNHYLNDSHSDSDTAHIYHQLGWTKWSQGKYKDAAIFYEKSLDIKKKILPHDHPSLAISYNNIGQVYHNMGNYSTALDYYLKAFKMREKILPPNDPELAISYNNMGVLYGDMGEYSRALEYQNQALRIKENSLSPFHPDLAISYNNIGELYNNMGEYSKALEFYQKAHKIKEKNLSTNDPNLAISYNNIGQVHNNMGDYTKALEFYRKALKIKAKSLPANHPDLAISYNNIGTAYNNVGDYDNVIEFYKKAHQIKENSLPANHPDLAISYNNIGQVYNNTGDYLKALEYYDKAHQIKKESLPSNHFDLAISYNNIGAVYNNMGDYLKTLEYYEKAHEIYEKSLQKNHPDLAISYSNIGQVYNNIGDYLKALEYYRKALEIREIALPPDHPYLADSQLDFASCYERLGDYTTALKSLHKALSIQQKTFKDGNAAFASTYRWFGKVYRSMKKYTNALEFYENCLSIETQTLHEKHPRLAISYSNVGDVHRLIGRLDSSISFHKRALNIQEHIPCNPLELATTYTNISKTYREIKDYSTALKYLQNGLDIRKNKLPKNHPDLAVSYHNFAKLYLATKQYSLAMENVQEAIETAQEKLPENHPYLLHYRKTLKKIQKCF